MSLEDNNLVPSGTEEDKTLTNEDDPLKDFPDEDETLGDKGEKKPDKPKSSEIAQKIKYREKYLASQKRIRELEEENSKKTVPSADDEDDKKEKAARDYIKKVSREEHLELLKERERKNELDVLEFNEELEIVLEENPDWTEEQIVDICEECKVSPKIAANIQKKLDKDKESKIKKPKLPDSKRGTGEIIEKKKDDSKKSIWDIANDIKRSLKSKKE